MPEPAAAPAPAAAPDNHALPREMRAALQEMFEDAKVPGGERKTFQKNLKLRHKNAELRAEIDKLRAAGPPDGGVVLSKDDAAEYTAFKALKLKAADVATLVKEHGELKTRDAERTDEENWVDAADALGIANLPLFMRMMKREGLHVEFETQKVKDEETGEVETVRVPMVRLKADEKAKLEPLADYFEREVPELIDVLGTAPEGEAGEDGTVPPGTEATGTESFSARVARMKQGDVTAARAAVAQVAGVVIPATRNARPSSGAARQEKKEKEAFEEKKNSGLYAAL